VLRVSAPGTPVIVKGLPGTLAEMVSALLNSEVVTGSPLAMMAA
jgi:hypothetical protein